MQTDEMIIWYNFKLFKSSENSQFEYRSVRQMEQRQQCSSEGRPDQTIALNTSQTFCKVKTKLVNDSELQQSLDGNKHVNAKGK